MVTAPSRSVRDVGESPPVRRVARFGRLRERHFRRVAARKRHREEARREGRTVARRAEKHRAAIRRPAGDQIRAGVVGQTAWDAARGLDDVDIGVAVVLAREGDESAVGREGRRSLGAGAGRQAARVAALAPDDPQVAREDEGDELSAHRRVAHDERRIRLPGAKREAEAE
ncbi:MAG: hypothetical protein LC802_17210 [Acidobacteria bacterium]|nr:hypothetical protein [Acidobacteriota bacterium]